MAHTAQCRGCQLVGISGIVLDIHDAMAQQKQPRRQHAQSFYRVGFNTQDFFGQLVDLADRLVLEVLNDGIADANGFRVQPGL